MTHYTKWAFDNAVEVDYLLGAEAYKFKFANRKVQLHIFVAAKTLLGRVALTAYGQMQKRRLADPKIVIGSAYRTENGADRIKSA